jgi:hypothetical protein
VRINKRLVARYRDWTWEARCQVSQLIEWALFEYHEQNRRKPR